MFTNLLAKSQAVKFSTRPFSISKVDLTTQWSMLGPLWFVLFWSMKASKSKTFKTFTRRLATLIVLTSIYPFTKRRRLLAVTTMLSDL
jgi:hypothetical protein